MIRHENLRKGSRFDRTKVAQLALNIFVPLSKEKGTRHFAQATQPGYFALELRGLKVIFTGNVLRHQSTLCPVESGHTSNIP
jgi:hypothetical protein